MNIVQILFSPDWSEYCLDGSKLRSSTTSNYNCTDNLTGQVTLCAVRCDRIDDGCEGKIDEAGCSPQEHTNTYIGVALVAMVVIILLVESILYRFLQIKNTDCRFKTLQNIIIFNTSFLH